MKKVLLIIIDALASRVIRPAIDEGRLPHLRSLIEAGWVDWRSTAIFPSITPAATAALATGGYPCETGISGAYFFDKVQDRIHYFGDDFWPILRQGFGAFFEDFLVRLNRDQLRIETLHQAVERAGGRAACLNFLWFRGDRKHKVHVPWLMKLWPGVPFSAEVEGPGLLSLGDFVSSVVAETGEKLQGRGGIKHRYGFDDVDTAEVLLRLVQSGPLPELTTAYFPDNDFDSHERGPAEAVESVAAVDRALGEIFAACGGLEKLLKEVVVVITGDHSQADLLHDEEQTGVMLDDLLTDFALVPVGKTWRGDDELLVCPNMRAAQIYVRRRPIMEVVEALLTEDKIDQVMWRENPNADPQGNRYHVATIDRGRLEFWMGASAISARDEYGALWSWKGDLATVDGAIDRDGVLRFEAYPNALERIATSFDPQVSGDVWVTARPGHEFRRKGVSVHQGGSHGALHALDSLSPLIVAGVPRPAEWRQTPRSVDVAALIRAILELPTAIPLGGSHVDW